jgi:hypothetical protein
VFCIDVAKVDQDIAYVAMVIHVSYKRLFQMFHLFFSYACCKCYLDVPYISHICLQVFLCCICCAMTFQVFLGVFASVLDACFNCFIFLQAHVAKVYYGCFKS